jgi:hypothetical protein
MGNVKIIGPAILKDLYLEQLDIMNRNYATNKTLDYSNIFKPKNNKN